MAIFTVYILFLYSWFCEATRVDTQKGALWAVEFPRADPSLHRDFGNEHGLEYIGPVNSHLDTVALFEQPHSVSKRSLLHLPNSENNTYGVVWVEEQVLIRVEKKSSLLPYSDPLLPSQWHLHNVTSKHKHVHLNVLPVWAMGITGKGSVIAFIDDGVDHDHPDLVNNWLSGSNNWNYNTRTKDVKPQDLAEDYHGTCVAGLAVAYHDGETCGCGVAPDAKFSSVVLLQHSTHGFLPSLAAQALTHAIDVNAIYCNSWGPKDDGLRKEGPNGLVTRAIQTGISKGRSGLGSLYLWAAGNGRQFRDNCNYDGYANSRYVVTVGAVTSKGVHTEYSEPCAALLGALPSGSGSVPLRTTDIDGKYGLNREDGTAGQCTMRFAGTSASAPLVAGIAALVLEANPNITWLDFQYILKMSTIKTDTSHGGWIQNGGGTWVSHEYGFGVIDSHLAVKNAIGFHTHVKEISWTATNEIPTAMLPGTPNNGALTASSVIYVNQTMLLHHVEITVTILHKQRGLLDIVLISPFGTESILAALHGDRTADYQGWKFTSLLLWGEHAIGNWTLKVTDRFALPNSTLVSWSLNLYGIDGENSDYSYFIKKSTSSSAESDWAWDLTSEVDEENSNSDEDGENETTTLFQSLFGTGREAMIKAVLMIGLVSGIFITVVTVIFVFVVKRDDALASVATGSIELNDTGAEEEVVVGSEEEGEGEGEGEGEEDAKDGPSEGPEVVVVEK